jgi:hypothetical protein
LFAPAGFVPRPPGLIFRGTQGNHGMTLEQAQNNLQGIINQLRLTAAERDELNANLSLLYRTAVDVKHGTVESK